MALQMLWLNGMFAIKNHLDLFNKYCKKAFEDKMLVEKLINFLMKKVVQDLNISLSRDIAGEDKR